MTVTATQDLTVSVTNVNEAPGKPRNLRYTGFDHLHDPDFAWDAPADDGGSPITNYQYEWRHQDQPTEEPIGGRYTLPATSRSGTIRGSDEDERIHIRVRAVNAVGLGEWTVISVPAYD